MDMERATTLSQTTSSSPSPASTRAQRHAQQNLSSLWCRDCWTWGICVINVTLTSTQPHKGRVRRRKHTRKQTQTGKTKHLRGQMTHPKISKHCHRCCWRHLTRIKWRRKPKPQYRERDKLWKNESKSEKALRARWGEMVWKCVLWCCNFSFSLSIHHNYHTRYDRKLFCCVLYCADNNLIYYIYILNNIRGIIEGVCCCCHKKYLLYGR